MVPVTFRSLWMRGQENYKGSWLMTVQLPQQSHGLFLQCCLLKSSWNRISYTLHFSLTTSGERVRREYEQDLTPPNDRKAASNFNVSFIQKWAFPWLRNKIGGRSWISSICPPDPLPSLITLLLVQICWTALTLSPNMFEQHWHFLLPSGFQLLQPMRGLREITGKEGEDSQFPQLPVCLEGNGSNYPTRSP